MPLAIPLQFHPFYLRLDYKKEKQAFSCSQKLSAPLDNLWVLKLEQMPVGFQFEQQGFQLSNAAISWK